MNLNPIIWFEIIYILLLLLFIIFNAGDSHFTKINLFTLLWAFPIIVFIHLFLSLKKIQHNKNELSIQFVFLWFKKIVVYYSPFIIMALIYENLSPFIKTAGNISKNYDLFFMQIDEYLFSVQPTIWMQKILHPITVEYFMVAYGLFFIYPFFYLVYLIHKNKIAYFQKVIFAENLMLIISLSCFILLPTWGPRFVLDPHSPLFLQHVIGYTHPLQGISIPVLNELTGYDSFFALQVDLWNYLERIKTDCFPSLHTGLCLLCLLYAIRYRDVFKYKKTVMWFWIAGVISLIISTVYLRYHWVIDVIAGIILTFFVYYFTEWFFEKWISLRKKHNLKFETLND